VTKEFLYWFGMLLLVICWFFWGYTWYDPQYRGRVFSFGISGVIVFCLFVLIGLKLFGEAIK
jgi:hypothetical protein